MYGIQDFVVCPGHGVGQIHEIEEKQLSSESRKFYIIRLVSSGMKIMVPIENEGNIRALVTSKEIDQVYHLLKDHDIELDTSTWNRRHREYLEKVKTGSLLEMAQVVRSLYLLKERKGLSFGEKKMLNQCKDLIVQELSYSQGLEEEQISQRIDSCFN